MGDFVGFVALVIFLASTSWAELERYLVWISRAALCLVFGVVAAAVVMAGFDPFFALLLVAAAYEPLMRIWRSVRSRPTEWVVSG